MNDSELSGDKVKEKLNGIVKSNIHKNLKGEVTSPFLLGLDATSKEALTKGVSSAYDEIRSEARNTQNRWNAISRRQATEAASRNWVANHRRTRNAQQNTNRSTARQRNFTARQRNFTARHRAASTIQRILGSRVRHVSRTASRPPLPAIRRRTTSRS